MLIWMKPHSGHLIGALLTCMLLCRCRPTMPQRRFTVRSPADAPALPPVAAGALQLLPPLAYAHQPASSFNIKFAGQAPSKVGGLAVAWLASFLLVLRLALYSLSSGPTR